MTCELDMFAFVLRADGLSVLNVSRCLCQLWFPLVRRFQSFSWLSPCVPQSRGKLVQNQCRLIFRTIPHPHFWNRCNSRVLTTWRKLVCKMNHFRRQFRETVSNSLCQWIERMSLGCKFAVYNFVNSIRQCGCSVVPCVCSRLPYYPASSRLVQRMVMGHVVLGIS